MAKTRSKKDAKETDDLGSMDSDCDCNYQARFTKIEELLADLKSSLTAKCKDIDNRLSEITKSQKFLATQYESFRKTVDTLMKDNVDLRKENAKLKDEICDLQRGIQQANDSINELEQYGRRTMVELAGVPRCDDEDAEELVANLCCNL